MLSSFRLHSAMLACNGFTFTMLCEFQVALYPADILQGPPIATSDSMFVHNNSKHGRRPIYRDTVVGDGRFCCCHHHFI